MSERVAQVRLAIILSIAAIGGSILVGCSGGDAPGSSSTAVPERSTGLIEVTLTGVGSSQMTSKASYLAPTSAPSQAITAKAGASATVVNGGIDLMPVAQSSFDLNGTRYLYATFKVRNAQACGTPGTCTAYTTARNNLTLIPASTSASIGNTPFSKLNKFDGSAADPAIAQQMLPTHGMAYNGTTLSVQPGLESLQIYTESELATFSGSVNGATNSFPYGFVVRNPNSTTSRALPAGPANNQFDGLVTIAYKLPLQATKANDPYSISLVFAVIDDANTRVSESAEETNLAGDVAAAARAALLVSGDVLTLGARAADINAGDPVCSVRTAGPASSPTAYLVNEPDSVTVRSAPSSLTLSPTDPLRLGFCVPMAAPSPSTLQVYGSMSGPRTASTSGTRMATWGVANSNQLTVTPNSGQPFLNGETVSYTVSSPQTGAGGQALTSSFSGTYTVSGLIPSSPNFVSTPVQMYEIDSAATPNFVIASDMTGDGVADIVFTVASGNNVTVLKCGSGTNPQNPCSQAFSTAVGTSPVAVAAGDFDGDGIADLAVVNSGDNTVSVLRGSATRRPTFPSQATYAVGNSPSSVAVGDFNGDGISDLAVANSGSNTVSILLGNVAGVGNGRGSFASQVTYAVGSSPVSLAVGDFNGDGIPDLAVANSGSNNASILLGNAAGVGNGRGSFAVPVNYAVGNGPSSVAVSDFNGDGTPDLAVTNESSNTVSILLGNTSGVGTGRGSFAGQVSYATNPDSLSPAPSAVAVGDFNGDGIPDLVITNSGSGSFSILLGNVAGSGSGRGSFSSAKNAPVVDSSNGPTQTQPSSAAVVDFDKDGRLDVVVTAKGAGSVLFYDGNNGNSN